MKQETHISISNGMFELMPINETRKSFYNKAKVIYNKNEIVLYSYNTKVCVIDNGKAILTSGTHSNTTLRHIKEFLKQNGFKADTKKQIETDYKIKEMV